MGHGRGGGVGSDGRFLLLHWSLKGADDFHDVMTFENELP